MWYNIRNCDDEGERDDFGDEQPQKNSLAKRRWPGCFFVPFQAKLQLFSPYLHIMLDKKNDI